MLHLGVQEEFGSRPCVPVRCLHPLVAGWGRALLAQQLLGQVPGWPQASGWARSWCWSHPGNSWQERSPPGLQQVHLVLGQICQLRKDRRRSCHLLPSVQTTSLLQLENWGPLEGGRGFPGGIGACRMSIAQGEHPVSCSLHCKSPGAENPGASGVPDKIQEETPGHAPRPRFTYFQ